MTDDEQAMSCRHQVFTPRTGPGHIVWCVLGQQYVFFFISFNCHFLLLTTFNYSFLGTLYMIWMTHGSLNDKKLERWVDDEIHRTWCCQHNKSTTMRWVDACISTNNELWGLTTGSEGIRWAVRTYIRVCFFFPILQSISLMFYINIIT